MKRTIYFLVCIGIASILASCNGRKGSNGTVKKADTVTTKRDTIVCKKDTVEAKRKEEPPKFSAKNMVGVWDYYANPKDKFEIIFKKNGTLIDFIDFHTTGTYKVNPEGTIITFQFFHYTGESSEKSKPMKFNIVKYTHDHFIIKSMDGGDPIHYQRKAKSMNTDEKL